MCERLCGDVAIQQFATRTTRHDTGRPLMCRVYSSILLSLVSIVLTQKNTYNSTYYVVMLVYK